MEERNYGICQYGNQEHDERESELIPAAGNQIQQGWNQGGPTKYDKKRKDAIVLKN